MIINRILKVSAIVTLMAVICSILAPVAANAQSQGSVISPENKTAVGEQLHQLIEQNKDSTPSVAITIFDDKQDICSVIYGKSDIENNITADGNTVYEWCSVNKLLVWGTV